VTERDPKRESLFPAIEKKYGQPVAHWLRKIKAVPGGKYADQMALLIDDHGMSRNHANAIVMYARGSATTRRFNDAEAYFAHLGHDQSETMRSIFATLMKAFPELELVIAWNQPMLKYGKKYVFGASAAKNHLLLAPTDASVLDSLTPRLAGFVVNKKTVQVPTNWKADKALLRDMVAPQIE
jgi:uncharacterized protein YdhG (YjbR/CyaY superfamily)